MELISAIALAIWAVNTQYRIWVLRDQMEASYRVIEVLVQIQRKGCNKVIFHYLSDSGGKTVCGIPDADISTNREQGYANTGFQATCQPCIDGYGKEQQ